MNDVLNTKEAEGTEVKDRQTPAASVVKDDTSTKWLRNSVLTALFLFAGWFIAQVGINIWEKYPRGNDSEAAVPTPTQTSSWKTFQLEGTDISIELPGTPNLQPIPEQVKGKGSVHSYLLQQGGGAIIIMETQFPEGTIAVLKQIAEASMNSFKGRDSEITYEISVVSNAKAKLTGKTSPKMKNQNINGCYLIKNSGAQGNAWTILIVSAEADVDATRRILGSVKINGLDENCK